MQFIIIFVGTNLSYIGNKQGVGKAADSEEELATVESVAMVEAVEAVEVATVEAVEVADALEGGLNQELIFLDLGR